MKREDGFIIFHLHTNLDSIFLYSGAFHAHRSQVVSQEIIQNFLKTQINLFKLKTIVFLSPNYLHHEVFRTFKPKEVE